MDELAKKAALWGISYPFDILIGMNGSELWDNLHQKEFSYFKMKKEWIKETMELMKPFDSNCFIYRDDCLLCERDDAQTVSYTHLDVYKRQYLIYADILYTYRNEEKAAFIYNRHGREDVYKRQIFIRCSSIRRYVIPSTEMRF